MSHVKGNIKTLTKRNAWYAAWFATMAAAGWAIDELHNQVNSTTNTVTVGNVQCYAINGYYVGIVQGPSGCQAKIIQAYGASNISFRDPVPEPTPEQYACLLNASCNSAIVRFKFYNSTGSPFDGSYIIPSPSSIQVGTQTKPVTDDALYDSLVPFMLQDPKAAAQAFMVPDPYPYPYPHIFPDPIEYIPGVSQSDQELLDALIKGHLQTTNPSAANYVTPEKYAELQATLTRLQQGLSPEAIVGELNDKLKEPITQAQLEETLKKEKEAEAKADQEAATKAQEALAPSESALDKLSQDNTWLEQQITDAANASPPTMGLGLPQWVWPSGRCQPFPFTFTVGDLSAKADDKGTFCTFYNDVAHPLIYWFINLLVALYIFVLWNKTMLQVIGAR